MKSTSLGLLQIFLWCVCAFHVIVGVAVNFSTDFIKLMATWYGARVGLHGHPGLHGCRRSA
jgi:hypothetical protein